MSIYNCQSGGFLHAFLDKCAGSLTKVAVPVDQNVASLAIIASASAIDVTTKRKPRGSGVLSKEKRINVVISNEDMNDIIRIKITRKFRFPK